MIRERTPANVTTKSKAARPAWFPVVWAGPLAAIVVVGAVLAARWYVGTDSGMNFLNRYPGESALPAGTPEGFPWWVQVTHSLNFILIVLLVRSGWMVHSERQPSAYWTRTVKRKPGKPAPAPTKMSIYLWLHLMMDIAWVFFGLIFVVLLFVSGHWARVVPVHWDIFPNAASAALQYASLDWPINEPWLNYNAIQVLAYFSIIFIAAPLAALTGIRMSPIWPKAGFLSRIYPVQLARRIHFPVMVYFVGFILVHFALVVSTGIRVNMDAMYATTVDGSTTWWGLLVFIGVTIVGVAAWAAARPMFLAPVASMTGRVSAR